jgi:hypothetical protein
MSLPLLSTYAQQFVRHNVSRKMCMRHRRFVGVVIKHFSNLDIYMYMHGCRQAIELVGGSQVTEAAMERFLKMAQGGDAF